MQKKKRFVLTLILCIILFNGCGQKTENSEVDLETEITQESQEEIKIPFEFTESEITLNKTGHEQLLLNNDDNSEITYSSSDESIVKVSETGEITALQRGKATVSAQNETGETAECSVIVEMPYVTADELKNGYYIRSGEKFYKVTSPERSSDSYLEGIITAGLSDYSYQLPAGSYPTFEIFLYTDIEKSINPVYEGEDIVVVTSSGEPPSECEFVVSDASDYAISTEKVFPQSDGTLYANNNRIVSINGNENLKDFNYTLINGDIISDDVFLQGKPGETFTVTTVAGTQGTEDMEYECKYRIYMMSNEKENKLTVPCKPPENGYAVVDISSLEKGYFTIPGYFGAKDFYFCFK